MARSQHSSQLRFLLLAVALALAACADPAALHETGPSFSRGGGKGGAKNSGSPTVTAVSPSWGAQGESIDRVRIIGSGFDESAEAEWHRDGALDTRVIVRATRFVSSTEVEADITLEDDAEIALYDVHVVMSGGGKRGIGLESFEVTKAEVLDDGASVSAMSEGGAIVGTYSHGLFVWEEGVGITQLASSGQAGGIDPAGMFAFGQTSLGSADPVATVWMRQGAGSWSADALPVPQGGNGRSSALRANRTPDGALIAVGSYQLWITAPIRRGKNLVGGDAANRPLLWTRSGTSWTVVPLGVPEGLKAAHGADVSSTGTVVGRGRGWDPDDPQGIGIVWDQPGSPVILDGVPVAINAAGTIAVGWQRVGTAGEFSRTARLWRRDASTGAWIRTGVELPPLTGGACATEAHDVNDAGLIAGISCNEHGTTQGVVWFLDMTGPVPVPAGAPLPLPGAGGKSRASSPISEGNAIRESLPHLVAGIVTANGQQIMTARWLIE